MLRRLTRRDRQHRAAHLARAERLARVELLDRGAELRLDVLAGERDLVQLLLTSLAEPREPVELVRTTLALDDQPPRRRRPNRAVRRSRAAEEDVAFAHGDVAALAVGVDDLHGDVAGELVEDLV